MNRLSIMDNSRTDICELGGYFSDATATDKMISLLTGNLLRIILDTNRMHKHNRRLFNTKLKSPTE